MVTACFDVEDGHKMWTMAYLADVERGFMKERCKGFYLRV